MAFRLFETSENINDRHAGRGGAVIRHPEIHCFFWIPDIRPWRIPE
jgi:hypothetical protein